MANHENDVLMLTRYLLCRYALADSERGQYFRPDGSPELSDTGRSILDQDMSELVPHLPNNPLMIEGYCENGAPDQRYLTSRLRAMEVREYLVSRFHLDSKRVGIMPLGDRPPAGTRKQTWDGISLVLVVSQP